MQTLQDNILKLFGRTRRPFAWFILVVGIIGFLGTLFKVITTGDAYWVTMTGFVALFLQGFDSVQAAEDSADSPASAENQA